MNNSTKRGDPTADHLGQESAVGRLNGTIRHAHENDHGSDDADHAQIDGNKPTSDHARNGFLTIPGQSFDNVLEQGIVHNTTQPPPPASSEFMSEPEGLEKNHPQTIRNQVGAPDYRRSLPKTDDSFQDDDLFELFEEDSEFLGETEPGSEQRHFYDHPVLRTALRNGLEDARTDTHDPQAPNNELAAEMSGSVSGTESDLMLSAERKSQASSTTDSSSQSIPPQLFNRGVDAEPNDCGASDAEGDTGNAQRELRGRHWPDDEFRSFDLPGQADKSNRSEENVPLSKSAQLNDPESKPDVSTGSICHQAQMAMTEKDLRPAEFDRFGDQQISSPPTEIGNGSQNEIQSSHSRNPRDTFNRYQDEYAKNGLTVGVVVFLAVVAIVVGGYLLNLESQSEKLRSLLPADLKTVFDDGLEPASDPQDQAVMENMNARIGDLETRFGRLAIGNAENENRASGDTRIESGVEQLPPAEGVKDRFGELSVGQTEFQQIILRMDNLEKSVEEIGRMVDEQRLRDLRTASGVPLEEFNGVVDPPQVAESESNPASEAGLSPANEPVQEKPLSPDLVPPKPQIANARKEKAWSVNLMSLEDASVAKQELENILKKEIAADIAATNVSGKTWYRVRVTGFESQKQAQEYGKTVAKTLGLQDVWVTR